MASLRCGGKELCLLDDARCNELYFEKLPKHMSEQRYAADKIMSPKSSADLNDDKVDPGMIYKNL